MVWSEGEKVVKVLNGEKLFDWRVSFCERTQKGSELYSGFVNMFGVLPNYTLCMFGGRHMQQEVVL